MPAKNDNKSGVDQKPRKKFNPTIAVLFDAPEFGLDATPTTPKELVVPVTLRSGEQKKKILGTAFKTKRTGISEEDFKTIQQHVKPGIQFLLRVGAKLNSNGGRNIYLELLESQDAGNFKYQDKNTRTASSAKSEEDDI